MERGLSKRIDRYLRREDTLLARGIRKLDGKKGLEYLNGKTKRRMDRVVATPLAVMTTPLVCGLGVLKKIEDGGPAFFNQERIGSRGRSMFVMQKIRCMKVNSDKGRENCAIAGGKKASEDERNTRLGKFMRKFQLEELPQLRQVVSGDLTLLGLRPETPGSMEEVRVSLGVDYQKWRSIYDRGPLGISGASQIFGASETKSTRKKLHPDLFYGRKATLGLDLYLVWRTAIAVASGKF